MTRLEYAGGTLVPRPDCMVYGWSRGERAADSEPWLRLLPYVLFRPAVPQEPANTAVFAVAEEEAADSEVSKTLDRASFVPIDEWDEGESEVDDTPTSVVSLVAVTPFLAGRLLAVLLCETESDRRQRRRVRSTSERVLAVLQNGMTAQLAAPYLGLPMHNVEQSLRFALWTLQWAWPGGGQADLLGSGVPRRPHPGSLAATAYATPEQLDLVVRAQTGREPELR